MADARVVRLIKKWLHAGVREDGRIEHRELGTVQGGSISPLQSPPSAAGDPLTS